jgi:diguanylate cyclase (GGDEF)-like protein/PAS domain S-box-containing protein
VDKPKVLHGLLLGAATAALFLIGAYGSRLVALQSSGLEALWPSNAIVLAMLILIGGNRTTIFAIAGGQMAGGILLHLFRDDPALVTITLSVANVVESLLVFALLRRIRIASGLIDRVGDFFSFVMACATAAMVSSTLGALGLWLGQRVPFWDAWQSWYVSGVLSQLVVTPTIVVVADILRGRRMRDFSILMCVELLALLALIAAATTYVFFQRGVPSTFIVAPCVLLATFRLRALGAVAGVALVAIIAASATAAGHGSIAHLLQRPGDQVLLLQAFIATQLLTALPVAAILSERDLRTEETRAFAEHFRSMVENIGEVIFRIDRHARWTYLNPAWEKLTGQRIDASLGRSWLELVEPNARGALAENTAAVLRGERESTGLIVRMEMVEGLRWVELFVQRLHDQDGRIAGATGTLRDIDDRKRIEEHVITAKRRAEQRAREATLLASTDELTGIANRRAFMSQLEREIAGAMEFGWPLAVAIFDVDHFKLVNDCYGHAVGDRVLQLIAGRAAAVVRGGDMVGRLGGEEFGILMPGAAREEATLVAERLREAMEAAADGDDSLPKVTVSVGISMRESHSDAASLLMDADMALYAAKGEGRNRVRVAA